MYVIVLVNVLDVVKLVNVLDVAIDQALQRDQEIPKKISKNTIQILKDSFKPLSQIHNKPRDLIKSIKWFSTTNDNNNIDNNNSSSE